jgi:hypothetical protein
MARRPASILLLGILHLVGGALGLFCCTGCGGFLQVTNAHIDLLQGNNQGAAGPAIQPGASTFQQSTELGKAIDLRIVKAVPSYRIYTIHRGARPGRACYGWDTRSMTATSCPRC